MGGAGEPGNISLLQALRQVSEFAREAVQDTAQDPGAQHLISEAIIAEELAEPAAHRVGQALSRPVGGRVLLAPGGGTLAGVDPAAKVRVDQR